MSVDLCKSATFSDLENEVARHLNGSSVDEDDDDDSELVEQSCRVAAFANRRAEEKRKRTLNAAKETVQPSTPSPSQQEAEIREGELLEGPGTYQGLKRTEVSDNQKQLKQKKQQMKQGRVFLQKEQDILPILFPATPKKPETAKRGRGRGRGGRKRTTASATRTVESPPPQSVTTPKRLRGTILI